VTGRHLRALPVGLGAGAVAAVTIVLLLTARPRQALPGLPDAGAATQWQLPVVRALLDVAAVGTVGFLLTGAVLLSPAADALDDRSRRALRAASGWASGWAVLALLTCLLTLSDVLGRPVPELPWREGLLGTARSLPQVRALVLVGLIATTAALLARQVRTSRNGRRLLLVAMAGLLPLVWTGHAAASAGHQQALSNLTVHVLAATLWVGGLLGLVLFGAGAGPGPVRRFSTLALACFTAVALSGLLSAWSRLGPSLEAWSSSYGRVVLAKSLLLGILAGLGRQHRRHALPALAAGRPRTFVRLAVVELLVMSAAVGLAAGLARTPAPARPVAPSVHGLGHATLPPDLAPLTPGRLLTQWSLDALVLMAVALALVGYLGAVRRIRGAGRAWPTGRIAAAVGAGALTVLSLCGGLAVYSTALLSMQVAQLLVVLLVVPALVVRSGAVSLLAGRSRHAAVLSNPANGFAGVGLLLIAVYGTSLLELSLRSPWVHLAVNASALAAGSLLLWPLLEAGATPIGRTARERTLWLCALLAVLAAGGAGLALWPGLLAGDWFEALRWSWVDPRGDQRRAAAVTGQVVLLLAPVLLAVVRPPAAPRRRGTSRR
jgi:putative copper export protein/cytochrome c oxidase assembly factor CtaG